MTFGGRARRGSRPAALPTERSLQLIHHPVSKRGALLGNLWNKGEKTSNAWVKDVPLYLAHWRGYSGFDSEGY